MNQVVGLFPTPVMRVEKLLSDELIAELTGEVVGAGKIANAKSDQLSHTEIMSPEVRASFVRASELIQPKLVEFGALLFGEELEWLIKEIWVNLLETGGKQSIHTHANSFVSG